MKIAVFFSKLLVGALVFSLSISFSGCITKKPNDVNAMINEAVMAAQNYNVDPSGSNLEILVNKFDELKNTPGGLDGLAAYRTDSDDIISASIFEQNSVSAAISGPAQTSGCANNTVGYLLASSKMVDLFVDKVIRDYFTGAKDQLPCSNSLVLQSSRPAGEEESARNKFFAASLTIAPEFVNDFKTKGVFKEKDVLKILQGIPDDEDRLAVINALNASNKKKVLREEKKNPSAYGNVIANLASRLPPSDQQMRNTIVPNVVVARDARGFDVNGRLAGGAVRDARGFDVNGRLAGGAVRDARGFDVNGRLAGGAVRDLQGFDANGYHLQGPAITGVTPDTGTAGQRIRIEGDRLHALSTVKIGTTPCTVTAANLDLIFCTVNAGAVGPQPITITLPDNRSVTKPAGFRFIPDKHNLPGNLQYAELTREEGLDKFPRYRAQFNLGKAVLDGFVPNAPHIYNHAGIDYKVNYQQIAKDPFLHMYNSDPNSLYPDLTLADRQALSTTLVAAGMLQPDFLRQAQGLGNTQAEMKKGVDWNLDLNPAYVAMGLTRAPESLKQAIFKRIKRLVVVATAAGGDQLGTLALALGNNYVGNRCIDGVQDSLVDLERDRLGMAVLPPQTFGEMISLVLTEYKENFIRQHEKLFAMVHNAEPRTDGMGLLRGRATYLFGLRGDAPVLQIPVFSLKNDARLKMDQVMERFLQGDMIKPYSNNIVPGSGNLNMDDRLLRLDNRAADVQFGAYSVPKMLELLKKSRRKAFIRPSYGVPPAFRGKLLMDEASYRAATGLSLVGFRLKQGIFTNLIQDEVNQDPAGDFSYLWDNDTPAFAGHAADRLIGGGFNTESFINMVIPNYSNDFFKAADVQALPPNTPPGTPNEAVGDSSNFYLSDEAWLYLLKKYGYILQI